MTQHIPVTMLPAEEQLAHLRAEVARLEEALDAMSGDLQRVLHERGELIRQRDRLHTTEDNLRAEGHHARLELERAASARVEMVGCLAELAHERDRALEERDRLREALLAVGRLIPRCGCGVPACQRCAVIRQRAAALDEDVSPTREAPTAAG